MPSNMKLAGTGAKIARKGGVRKTPPTNPKQKALATEVADLRKENALLKHQLGQAQQENADIRVQAQWAISNAQGYYNHGLQTQVLALNEDLQREKARNFNAEKILKVKTIGLEQKLHAVQKTADDAVKAKTAAEKAKNAAFTARAAAQKAADDAAKALDAAAVKAKAASSTEKKDAVAAAATEEPESSGPARQPDEARKGAKDLAEERIAAMKAMIEDEADGIADKAEAWSLPEKNDEMEDDINEILIDAMIDYNDPGNKDPNTSKKTETIVTRKIISGQLDKLANMNGDLQAPFNSISECAQRLAKASPSKSPQEIAATKEFAEAFSQILEESAKPCVTPEQRIEKMDETVTPFVASACRGLRQLFPDHVAELSEALKPLFREAFQCVFLHHATRIREQHPGMIKCEWTMDHLPTS
ncbi:MAG: hypothetical protein M1831_003039 [Alyxoria varia]|nr:MAG: hypothetical protein M1831_003039 [Alyxoria varia]